LRSKHLPVSFLKEGTASCGTYRLVVKAKGQMTIPAELRKRAGGSRMANAQFDSKKGPADRGSREEARDQEDPTVSQAKTA
jgi:hypothetical protein